MIPNGGGWHYLAVKKLLALLKVINAVLKISLYTQIHIKIIPLKFRILNRKNSRVIHQ